MGFTPWELEPMAINYTSCSCPCCRQRFFHPPLNKPAPKEMSPETIAEIERITRDALSRLPPYASPEVEADLLAIAKAKRS